MAIQKQELRTQRWSAALIGLSALLGALSACAKIVGIEDTPIERGPGSAGVDEHESGAAGSAQAGTSNAGHSNGGSGAAATAGSSAGGPIGGTAGSGGVVNQAGSPDKAGNGGSAGSSECPCSAPKPSCENGKCVVRGPTMAKATSYYIDSTEVTKAQYDVFLGAKGSDTSGQVPECSWNMSYAPAGTAVDDPRPIVNVDWCDAAAFCSWADKRLCGAIAGGPVGESDVHDSTKAQMYLACAGADNERYPYGGFTLMPDYCNAGPGYMADVGKYTMCQGHYMGIFDLVGNAAEWIDSCDTFGGADHSMDNCQLGGGSNIKSDYKCETYFSNPRSGVANLFGFRCCSK